MGSSFKLFCISVIAVFVLLAGDTRLLAQRLFFSNLSVKDGLPSNIISAIVQDQADFIWVGTGNGLARYDGNQFKTFRKNESANSISSNEISCLLAHREFVWVGTWNGLCKINIVNYEVTRIDLGKNNAVRVLYKPRDENSIWIGTETGLIHFDIAKNEITDIFNRNKNGLSHNTIRSIYEDQAGTLWVGTYDKLNKLVAGNDQFEVFDLKGTYRPSLKNNLISGDIRPYSTANDSLLWIGTETGLCLFDTRNGTFRHFGEANAKLSNEVIKSIYHGGENKLWLGTDFGLNIFDPATSRSVSYFHNPQIPYSIANNAIWQIFEDSGGVIWFVTSNGLSRLSKSRNYYDYHEVFNRIDNQLVGNQIKSILITKKGITWLATLHGVIRIDGDRRDFFDTNSLNGKKILLNNTYALEEDNYGRIWIGTAGGINIWDEAEGKMYAITANSKNGLITNYIAKFVKGPDGSLWAATYEGGLMRAGNVSADPESIHFESIVRDFGSEKLVAGAGSIWYSKYNKLLRIDQETLQISVVDRFNALTDKGDIHCLHFSADGTLWAGTQNGLIKYDVALDQATFKSLSSGGDQPVGNISEDSQGNIIGVTSSYLFRYNKELGTTEIFPLDKDLPLKSFYYGCTFKKDNGEILFGGDNGYITVQPETLTPNRFEPKVYVTALEINNKLVNNNDAIDGHLLLKNDISFTRELTLDYAHRSSITFEFSSLHYWQPNINTYAYQLEGFDEDWNYVSGLKNFAVYSNLTPGTYTFRVRGTNNYGQWSEHESAIQIRIKPPLFLSQGFLMLYAALAILLGFIGLRTYSARLRLTNELKITRLEKQHTEELAQAKQQFFTNISHELRTPISLILPPIHQILRRGNLDNESLKLIKLAEKNSHRLLRVINQILDFRKLENDSLHLKATNAELVSFCQDIHALFSDKAERKQITFSFTTTVSELNLFMDTEKIETVLFNLLSNAFKFTHGPGEITLSINKCPATGRYPDGCAEIVVSDTGIGMDESDKQKVFEPFYQTREAKQMEAGTGIGLALALEYARLHHGNISIESTKGKGSCFTVRLPLGVSHLPKGTIDEATPLKENVTPSPVEQEDTTVHPDKPRILVIDDSRDIVDFISISLRDKYTLISAENGAEGFQKTNTLLPDVIISDIMMPVMDGITLCRKVKSDPRTSHIAIILLTAKDLPTHKVEGVRGGADVYITKPFDIEFLEANIEHLLVRRKELSDYLKNELLLAPPEGGSQKNIDDMFLRRVIDIIDANIANTDFTVETLSAEIGMSSTHLYRKLKSITRLSANEIIKKYRLKKASLLLRNKEGNISEIMYEVGFSNLSYFSKCFRSEYGMTPRDYQQKTSKTTHEIEDAFGLDDL